MAVSDGQTTTVLDARTRRSHWTIRLTHQAGDVGTDGRPLSIDLVSCLAWTPDSAILILCAHAATATGASGSLVRVDPSTGRRVDTTDQFQGFFDGATVSPDGQTLAVFREGVVVLLDTETLSLTKELPAGERAGSAELSFSPDGRRLAVITESGQLIVVDTSNRALPPIRFGSALLQAEWLPDGRTLAVATADGEVTLLDSARGQLRAAPVSASGGRSADVYLVPESRETLVALTGVHPGRRWPLDTTTLVEHACAVVGRDLRRTEWDQYVPERPWRPTCSDLG